MSKNEKGLAPLTIILLVIAAAAIIFVTVSIISAFSKTVDKLNDSSEAAANSQASYPSF